MNPAQELISLRKALSRLQTLVYTNTNRDITLLNRFFTANANGFIADNNFDFDAGLQVSGDFVANEKEAYALMIANALNNYAALQQENTALKNQLDLAQSVLNKKA